MSNESPLYPHLRSPFAAANPYSRAVQAPMMVPTMGNPMVPGSPPILGASMQASKSPTTPPIKSLQDALEKAKKDLGKQAVNVRDMMQLLQKTAVASRSMFGEKAALTQHLLAEMKDAGRLAAAKQDCRALFAEHLKHAEELFRQLSVLAEVG